MNLLIEYVTRYYAGKEFREPEWHGYLYAVTMLICISGVSLLNAQAYAQVCEAHPFHKVYIVFKKMSNFRATFWPATSGRGSPAPSSGKP